MWVGEGNKDVTSLTLWFCLLTLQGAENYMGRVGLSHPFTKSETKKDPSIPGYNYPQITIHSKK